MHSTTVTVRREMDSLKQMERRISGRSLAKSVVLTYRSRSACRFSFPEERSSSFMERRVWPTMRCRRFTSMLYTSSRRVRVWIVSGDA